jgi:hypothetical protein
MKPREDNPIAIPPALLEEIQEAADEDRRPAGEVLREAVERYLENRRWQRLFAYGEERARALGLTEADIPRLIEESRRERAQAPK